MRLQTWRNIIGNDDTQFASLDYSMKDSIYSSLNYICLPPESFIAHYHHE